MVTLSPAFLAMLARSSALMGNLCVPLPRAMNELLNGRPSTVPLTFTSPRVLKYCAEPGMTTYVHPPLLGLRCNFAVNVLLRVLMVHRGRHRAQRARPSKFVTWIFSSSLFTRQRMLIAAIALPLGSTPSP